MNKIALITAIAFGAMSAKAQLPQPDPDTTAKHFLIVASIGNLQEVSAGQLASQKGKTAAVRDFGQMMVKDHGQAEQRVLALAKRKNIMLPAAATGNIKPDIILEKAGDHFDKAYVHAMVAGHGNTVEMFENYATVGKDPDVRLFAQQTLPTLKMHLEKIKAIEKQMSPGK